MRGVNWGKVRDYYERETSAKLNGLPSHREVPKRLRELRNIISHELPETASMDIFQKLIRELLKENRVNLVKIRSQILQSELKKERDILNLHKEEFQLFKKSAKNWVRANFPEEKLKKMWESHETWLPRRYTIYQKAHSFQQITTDTLVRYYLVKKEKP